MIKSNEQSRGYNKSISQSPQGGDQHNGSIQLLARERLEYIESKKNNPY